METHPYKNLPLSAFWRTGVTEADPNDMQEVYKKNLIFYRVIKSQQPVLVLRSI